MATTNSWSQEFEICYEDNKTFLQILYEILSINQQRTHQVLPKKEIPPPPPTSTTTTTTTTAATHNNKAVPLHAMEAYWGRGGIAPTHS
jgi:hypothetical protein